MKINNQSRKAIKSTQKLFYEGKLSNTQIKQLEEEYKKDITILLEDKSTDDIVFRFLVYVYFKFNKIDLNFLKSIIDKETKIFRLFTLINSFSDLKISKAESEEYGLEQFFGKLFDKHFYKGFSESKNKFQFTNVGFVSINAAIIFLFGRYKWHSITPKLIEIVNTQEKNEPTLYWFAKEALKNLEGY